MRKKSQNYAESEPEESTYLHSDSQDNPSVFIDIVDFDRIVDLLLSASKEASKCINELVVNCACTQVMSLVFHHSHLGPFVLLDFVLFDRVKTLFAAEAAEDVHVAAAHGNGMRVSTLIHRALVCDLVLNGAIDASVFLGRTAASSYQDLVRAERDRCGALVELGSAAVRQLFDRPFVFIDVIAEANLRVHVVPEKINSRRLILGTLQATKEEKAI